MEFWLIAAALSSLSVAGLYFGAQRFARRLAGGANSSQIAIYKDQLTEIEADLSRGVIAPAEAEAHRTEVARRLLSASSLSEEKPDGGRGWFILVPALLVPLLAFAIYAQLGAPALRDLPQAERLAAAEQNNDLEAMVYKVESHLAKKPNDVAGWEVVLPIYQTMGRFADAAEAHRRLIALKGPSAELYANLSEMLMFAGNGLMPAEGTAAAREALKLDPAHSKARYYDALSLSQEGKTSEALLQFEKLLADTPGDAPWLEAVEKQIATLKAPVDLGGEDQQAMIRGMVEGLAGKLEADPKNLEGWLRLIRARVVLQESDLASVALATARKTFDGDQTALAQLAALATELDVK